jgi:ethanolamine utilization microcompartment shell protein EutL
MTTTSTPAHSIAECKTDPELLEALRNARPATAAEIREQRIGFVAAECGVSKERVREVLGTPTPGEDVVRLREALQSAIQFIRNGVEFGYIRMPDPELPDTAHLTLPKLEAALASLAAGVSLGEPVAWLWRDPGADGRLKLAQTVPPPKGSFPVYALSPPIAE